MHAGPSSCSVYMYMQDGVATTLPAGASGSVSPLITLRVKIPPSQDEISGFHRLMLITWCTAFSSADCPDPVIYTAGSIEHARLNLAHRHTPLVPPTLLSLAALYLF